MKYLKLIKLMYLVDREAFAKWGHPITGDRYVSMPYGPVLSNALDLIHGDVSARWDEFIQESAPHTLKLMKQCPTDRLSDAEESLIEEVFQKFGHMQRWDLVNLTHKFPEYRQTDDQNRRWPISDKDILMAVGKTDEEAASICKHRADVHRTRSLLGA